MLISQALSTLLPFLGLISAAAISEREEKVLRFEIEYGKGTAIQGTNKDFQPVAGEFSQKGKSKITYQWPEADIGQDSGNKYLKFFAYSDEGNMNDQMQLCEMNCVVKPLLYKDIIQGYSLISDPNTAYLGADIGYEQVSLECKNATEGNPNLFIIHTNNLKLWEPPKPN